MGARPWTAEALAKELGLSPPHLLRFLRGLVTLGICEERTEGNFALTSLGQSLKPGSPSRLGEKVLIVSSSTGSPWADLVSTLQTGTPAFDHVFGTDVWDWRNENFRGGDIFAAYLAGETFGNAGPIVEALIIYRRRPHRRHRRRPRRACLPRSFKRIPTQGILFDLPGTIIGAKKFLKSHGVFERVTFVGGDFIAEIPVEADLYVLKSVLSIGTIWAPAPSSGIAARPCRPRAKLAIIERLLPEAASGDPGAVMLDLHMMVITGGRVARLASRVRCSRKLDFRFRPGRTCEAQDSRDPRTGGLDHIPAFTSQGGGKAASHR